MDIDTFLAQHSAAGGRFVSRATTPKPASPVATGTRDQASRGRRATSAGKAFEQRLTWAHQCYAENGIAQIYKAEVPTQPAPRHLLARQAAYGMVRIFSARAKPDYYGAFTYIAGIDRFATPIQMEAKSNGEHANFLRIRAKSQKEHGVKEAQLETLVNDWRRFGIVGVLVWLNGDDRLIFLPDTLASAMAGFRNGTVDRLRAEDATTFPRVQMPQYGYIEHWLGPAVAWWSAYHTTPVQVRKLGENDGGERADSWSQGLGKTA